MVLHMILHMMSRTANAWALMGCHQKMNSHSQGALQLKIAASASQNCKAIAVMTAMHKLGSLMPGHHIERARRLGVGHVHGSG